ncbi:type II toxin-antitoxin system RelE/ParE family toxin, partial [Salmonella enterica subsp. enterica serovar Infantis]
MTVRVEWEKRAQRDREDIFLYLNREAGDEVAIAADDRLAGMTGILEENPLAGVKAGRLENQRKLVVPHFPFIIVYVAEKEHVRILRVLHTARKI